MVTYWCGFDFEVTEVFYFWFRLAGCGLVSGLNVAGFVLGFLASCGLWSFWLLIGVVSALFASLICVVDLVGDFTDL